MMSSLGAVSKLSRLDFQHLQQAAATQHRISRKDANVVRPF